MKRNKNNIIYLLLFIFIIFLVIYNIYNRFYKFKVYDIGQGEEYYNKKTADIYLFYDEMYYDFDGVANYISDDIRGRIQAGTRIGQISEINPNYKSIQKKGLEIDKEYINNLRDKLLIGQMESVDLYQNENSFNEEILKNSIIKSDIAGYYYPYLDGYEEIFHLKNLYNFNPNQIKINLKEDDDLIIKDNAYKIVNNSLYYAIVDIHDLNKNIKEDDKISILIDKNRIKGTVLDFKQDLKGQSIAVVEFDRGYEFIEGKRIINGEVIIDEKTGFKIPKSSILEENNNYYVKKVDNNGYVKTIPIEIINFDQEMAFINNKNKDDKLLMDFDKILMNPNLTEDGEIAN